MYLLFTVKFQIPLILKKKKKFIIIYQAQIARFFCIVMIAPQNWNWVLYFYWTLLLYNETDGKEIKYALYDGQTVQPLVDSIKLTDNVLYIISCECVWPHTLQPISFCMRAKSILDIDRTHTHACMRWLSSVAAAHITRTQPSVF